MIQELFELHKLAQREANNYIKARGIIKSLQQDAGKHFTGIIGPRGVGKTVLLKQLAREHANSLYISIDTLPQDESLFDLVKRAFLEYKVHYFLLDEVHFRKNFNGELKKIYDFLDVKIIFTSSIALAMYATSHDLSRRVRLLSLYPFSYREFLFFKRDLVFSPVTIDELIQQNISEDVLRSGFLFDEYLVGFNMPFSLEEPVPLEMLGNILNTIVEKDIPAITSLYVQEIDTIKKVIRFIGNSAVDGISYSSISRNCGITKYKAESYISLLEQAFVLHRILPKGTNVLKEPKIIMALPYRLLYKEKKDALGALREDFFISSLRGAGISVHYLKNTRGGKTPDYVINLNSKKIVFEIGGKGKGRQQFKGFSADRKIIFAHDDKIGEERFPLFLAGFLF